MEHEKKRLYRSSKDIIITGVAGGLASYFNIDSTVVRLLIVILSLAFPPLVLVYIIAAVIIPQEKTRDNNPNT